MPVSPARAAAFDILLRVEQADAYASELLHSSHGAELSTIDQNLATELVMGVLRWRSSIDQAIAGISSQSLARLDPEVLTALRLAAYQLGWLDRVPARAAIHESVELVKRARKRSAAPFTNAVLRKLAADPTSIRAQFEPLMSPADADTLASLSAHPLWLVRKWVSKFGPATATNICSYDQKVPVATIRLRSAVAEQALREEGIDLAVGAFISNARRVVEGDVTKTKAYSQNEIAIQDEASQLVAALVGKGTRILDCCAAPGGKTWSIADRNPGATVVAVEVHAHRAEVLRKRVQAGNVQVIVADIRTLPPEELFDRVLVDAPCSGTGTIARNPEIKWRLRPEDLVDLHSRQLAILQAAATHLAPEGRLIYSSCSLEREENETVVEEFLSGNPPFRLVDVQPGLEHLKHAGEMIADSSIDELVTGSYLRTIPGVHPCDGFFVALLERTERAHAKIDP